MRLDADDADVRGRHGADVGGHAGEEAAAADGDEDGVELADVRLAEDLDGGGPLAGDDVRIVEGRDDRQAVDGREAGALALGLVEIGAVEDDARAEAVDVLVLDRRRVERHDDRAGDAEFAARQGDPLRVVACGERGSQPECGSREALRGENAPAEQAMTPLQRSSSVSWRMRL